MTIPEDMSELVDVNIDRVDLVGKAANGHRFLLAKSADSPALIDPDTVRELIKDADAEPATADLVAFEGITAVLKAGRALSSANEAALRNASAAIQKVLASLPAPEEAPVEKETPVAEETAAAITADVPLLEAAVEKETAEPGAVEEVEKGGSLMAVYDARGNLVGAIKPSALTLIDSNTPADAAEEPADEPFEEAAADASGDEEIEPEDGAPAEAVGEDEELIPGTETVKSPVEKAETVAIVTEAPDVAALLKEALAPLVEKIAHAADLANEVKVLKERVEAYGREPDDRKSPLLNGADGKAGIAKRSAESDVLVDLTKAVEIAKEAGDPTKLVNAQQALAFAAIKDRFSGNS
ncbi:hypothetical protein [Arthrobacter sp. ISL-69]|uniref:hypothetical protein n=1 Tax=Arthrobacter sp. ISL-69 TaxID=2819113 RepID=UPI001BE9FE74|nr:hypothetical protein [Arthrobacter sp. ISL-69]MBT2537204.1 hypothetical protein [Arthrobacter sp. ISL-69]